MSEMQDNNEERQETETGGNGPELRSPFLKKLENYWYHYKWPTIITLFVAVAAVICIVQIAGTPKYDAQFTYAGPSAPSAVMKTNMQASFESVINAGSETRKTAVVSCYFITTSSGGSSSLVDEGIIQNSSLANREALNDEVISGQVVICLLSPAVFRDLSRHVQFVALSELYPPLKDDPAEKEKCRTVTSETGVVSYDDYAVQLKKTDFGQLPGFSNLPDDTLLCMTDLTAAGAWYSRNDYVKMHEQYREWMTAILEYRAPEE